MRFRRRLETRKACELRARWLVSLHSRTLSVKNGEQGFVNHIRNVFNSRCFSIGVMIVSSSVLGCMVSHNPKIVEDGNAIAVAQATIGGNDPCSGHAYRKAGRQVKRSVKLAVKNGTEGSVGRAIPISVEVGFPIVAAAAASIGIRKTSKVELCHSPSPTGNEARTTRAVV